MNDYKTIYDAIQASKGGTGYVVPDGAVDLGLPILFAEKMYGASEIGSLGTMGYRMDNPYFISINNEIIDISPWRIPTVAELQTLQYILNGDNVTFENNKCIISLNGNQLVIPTNATFYAHDLSNGGDYVTVWRMDQHTGNLTIGTDESYSNYLLFVCDPADWKTRWRNKAESPLS